MPFDYGTVDPELRRHYGPNWGPITERHMQGYYVSKFVAKYAAEKEDYMNKPYDSAGSCCIAMFFIVFAGLSIPMVFFPDSVGRY